MIIHRFNSALQRNDLTYDRDTIRANICKITIAKGDKIKQVALVAVAKANIRRYLKIDRFILDIVRRESTVVEALNFAET